MEVYFDNAATTQVAPEVVRLMDQVMTEDYGNPSSLHAKGAIASKYVNDARAIIAKTLKCDPKEILFTSGGTESNNMALIGGALANERRGKHIISTRIEHASVYNPLLYLEKQGFEITFLPVDRNGRVDLEELKNALRPDTILVSVMMVNNEIGAIEPIEEIGTIVKKYNHEILIHIDAIQAYGKLKISVNKAKIDLLSVSGHKIHGPKGIGFLYIRDKVKVRPLVYGGGQQRDLRSGTENVPGIAGLAKAAQIMYDNYNETHSRMLDVKNRFVEKVTELDGVLSNSGEAPHIASISFQGITRAETLLHALEARGVYGSAGSACSSNHPAISGTLKAIGLDDEYLQATLRFSFSIYSTPEEVDYAVQVIAEELPRLRGFVKR